MEDAHSVVQAHADVIGEGTEGNGRRHGDASVIAGGYHTESQALHRGEYDTVETDTIAVAVLDEAETRRAGWGSQEPSSTPGTVDSGEGGIFDDFCHHCFETCIKDIFLSDFYSSDSKPVEIVCDVCNFPFRLLSVGLHLLYKVLYTVLGFFVSLVFECPCRMIHRENSILLEYFAVLRKIWSWSMWPSRGAWCDRTSSKSGTGKRNDDDCDCGDGGGGGDGDGDC
jgi:hypothetical protein